MVEKWDEIKCEECGRTANLYENYWRGCLFTKQRTILCRYHKEKSERFMTRYYRGLLQVYSNQPPSINEYTIARDAAEKKYYKALDSAEAEYNKAMDSAEKRYNKRLDPYLKKLDEIEEVD